MGRSNNKSFSENVLIEDFSMDQNRRQGTSVIAVKTLTIRLRLTAFVFTPLLAPKKQANLDEQLKLFRD